MSSNIYVENEPIILPILKDGVTKIGDLWDCHNSKIVGENLFSENLDGDYVSVSPIETLDYQLIHSKSSSDKIKIVKVGGEVSLELLAGLISVKGSDVDYNNDQKQNSSTEQLICHFQRETYSVYAQPKAKDIIDDLVLSKIMKNELKATHFVRGLTLGAEIKADILVTQNESKIKSDIKGDVFGKLVYGPINASLKASLDFLDNENKEDYKLKINVHSVPGMNSEPKTIQELFKIIDSASSVIENHKHFQKCGPYVIGVPIRFVLVPLKQFINFDVQKLYIKLSDKVLKEFNDMLVRINDIKICGYISKIVLENNSSLAMIINDCNSSLSQEIMKYERQLQEKSMKIFEESVNVLKIYKNGGNIDQILDVIKRFETECNSSDIFESIVEFIKKGKAELRSIHSQDFQ